MFLLLPIRVLRGGGGGCTGLGRFSFVFLLFWNTFILFTLCFLVNGLNPGVSVVRIV